MSEPIPEFSRLISVARLSPQGGDEYLEAKPAERAALATRFDCVEISSLKAWLTLMPSARHMIAVTGKIQATIIQTCVVTLEPLTNRVELEVDLVFKPQEDRDGASEPAEYEAEEDVEYFSGGKIDLGEMVAQHLGVNIDPYPRKPNATLPVVEAAAKVEKRNPFAILVEKIKNTDTDQ